jgi:hypothetical protein
VGEGSQHATYTGSTSAATLGTAASNFSAAGAAGSTALASAAKFNGSFNDLAIGSAGIAVTNAGITVGGNVIGGQMNGQLGLQPKNGAPLVGVLAGVKYVTGPFTVGVVGMEFWEQGNVQLTGITQLRGRGLDVAGSYTVAPGFTVFAEYLWNDQYQGARNFITGALGSNANNNIKGQGFMIGNQINF